MLEGAKTTAAAAGVTVEQSGLSDEVTALEEVGGNTSETIIAIIIVIIIVK